MFVLRPPATSSQRVRAGFTLLELLVAITILGLMMPLLYAVTQVWPDLMVAPQIVTPKVSLLHREA